MHRVAVVAVPPVDTFDLSIPGLIFGGVEVDGRLAYDIRVCTAEPGIQASDPSSTCTSPTAAVIQRAVVHLPLLFA